jgi:hypothetical protein
MVIAQAAGLRRATGRIILRVEVEHQLAAGEVGEAEGLAQLIDAAERGGLVTGLEAGHLKVPDKLSVIKVTHN